MEDAEVVMNGVEFEVVTSGVAGVSEFEQHEYFVSYESKNRNTNIKNPPAANQKTISIIMVQNILQVSPS